MINKLALGLILTAVAALIGYRAGSNAVQVRWDRDRLDQAAAMSAAQAKEALDLKAAQDHANAAESKVIENAKQATAIDADLRRRIEWLRTHPATCPAVQTGSDPANPAGTASPAPDLSIAIASLAADCARDYADVAVKLEAIAALTK